MHSADEIIGMLETVGNLSEVAEVRTFEAHYEGAGMVEIKIYDKGTQDQYGRYSVTARPLDDEQVATTNPAPLLDTAIATTHWYQLEELAKELHAEIERRA